MDGSSNLPGDLTGDSSHAAAIEAARRQFEDARRRIELTPRLDPTGDRHALGADWLAESLPNYEIGSETHRGGQGVVFKCIQRGTRREVAIKVMRGGPFGSLREKARFDLEIHILGQLKHPNIVTIHESGTSAHGSFFVMDYIDGRTLDAHVSDAKLGVRETLILFAKICHAVNVAHLRGVIHRDLKPANIRVDRAGEPHVLDFGLAKVNVDDVLADGSSSARSVTGQFVGSLPWATPEQIDGAPGDIDIRTDVYALGVMLYQLLAGRFPYDVVGNVRAVLDNICHTEPPTPSTHRNEIDGEVDALILKCLRKEKTQRYQSAGDLARDIDRYLAGEIIDAKRDSGWYMLSKQLRRHRMAVTTAALFAFIVTAAFVTSLAFWRQAAGERDVARIARIDADRARDDAKKQEAIAKSVVAFLTRDVLGKLDPYNTQGEDLTARALFDQAADDVAAGAFKDKPLVEFEVRTMLGLVYLWMSEYSQAETLLRPALDIARRDLGAEHEKTLQTVRRLGTVLSYQGKVDEAEPLLREALEIQISTLGVDHLSTVLSRSALAGCYLDMRRPVKAEALYREVVEARVRIQGDDHPDTLASLSNLASALMSQGKLVEGEAILRRSLEAKRRVFGDRHPETLIDLQQIADLLIRLKRPNEAIPLAQEACEGLRKTLGNEHLTTIATVMILARAHEAMGNVDEARQLLSEALQHQREAGIGSHQSIELFYRIATSAMRRGKPSEAEELLREAKRALDRVGGSANDRFRVLAGLSNVLGEQGKTQEALAFASDSVELSRRTWGEDSRATIIAGNNYALSLLNSGKPRKAEHLFRTALASQRRSHDNNNSLTLNLMHNLALALGHLDKNAERESLLRAALEGRRSLLGDDDPLTLKTIHSLATALRAQDKLEEAEPLYREALATSEEIWPDGHFRIESYRRGLGVCLTALRRYDEAEPLLLLSYERESGSLRAGHRNRIEGVEKLIELYEAWNKPEQASRWRSMLHDEDNPES